MIETEDNRFIRLTIKQLDALFGDNYSNLTGKKFPSLIAKGIRDEMFVPFCWKLDPINTKAVYLNYLEFGKKDIKKKPSTLHVGMCLFGTNLIAIDQFGDRYKFCDPWDTIPDDRIIEIIEVNEELHGDEMLWQLTITDFVPFIKSKCPEQKLEIFCTIPDETYILKGLDYFIQRKISYGALIQYIKSTVQRGKLHHQFWINLGQKNNVMVTRSNYLCGLIDLSKSPEEIVENYFNLLGFRLTDVTPCKKIDICNKTIGWLENSSMSFYWKKIHNLSEKDCPKDLFGVGNLGYSVYLDAIPRANESIFFVGQCIEKPVLLKLKKLAPDHTNKWIFLGIFPPIIPLNEPRNLFYSSNLGSGMSEKEIRRIMEDTYASVVSHYPLK